MLDYPLIGLKGANVKRPDSVGVETKSTLPREQWEFLIKLRV